VPISSLVLQAVGLASTLIGSALLLRSLFISDEEIRKLSELPIRASRRFVGEVELVGFAEGDLESYRRLYIKKRKQERKNGRIALALLILGFLLQLSGVLSAVSAA